MTNYKSNLITGNDKLHRQVEELSRGLTKMKKKKLEESHHELIANFENSFQKYDQRMQHLDQDNYHRDVGDPIYNEIVVDWYSPLFYDVYFDYGYVDDDSINSDNSDIINNVLIHKLEVECEDNKEGVEQKKMFI